jgi:predicted RNA-binding Zn ribbon-like protein
MAPQSKDPPGELALIRAFVNTRDIDEGEDHVARPEELAAWLIEQGLLPAGATARAADVSRALRFREALRELLLANNDGHQMPIEAGRALNDVAARARLSLRVDADGAAHLQADGETVDAALGKLLVIVYRAMENDTWPRLKACRSDTCQWAFYDNSKNRSGHWCSMEVCGARHKAQQYRARHKSAGRRGAGRTAAG